MTFIDDARNEANRFHWDARERGDLYSPPLDLGQHMAEWARDQLISDRPSDEEVEAARRAVHRAFMPEMMAIASALDGDQERYDRLVSDIARNVLSASFTVRRMEFQ